MKITYEVVEHNGGFAYKVGDVFSETFATHAEAHRAAEDAAERQRLASGAETIVYQDDQGRWHNEVTQGDDRPDTEVDDHLANTAEPMPEDAFPNLDRAPISGETRQRVQRR
jgi:hypothetical protein